MQYHFLHLSSLNLFALGIVRKMLWHLNCRGTRAKSHTIKWLFSFFANLHWLKLTLFRCRRFSDCCSIWVTCRTLQSSFTLPEASLYWELSLLLVHHDNRIHQPIPSLLWNTNWQGIGFHHALFKRCHS